MLEIREGHLRLKEICGFLSSPQSVQVAPQVLEQVRRGRARLEKAVTERIPVYGVTTGFGDSCRRVIAPDLAAELQRNLVSYLLCGTGRPLPKRAVKAAFLIRLKSLSHGYSGVSAELLERMRDFLNRDWIPVIPCEGSLGASGDLIPLAYLARALRGEGEIYGAAEADSARPLPPLLRQSGFSPYTLQSKEGLALVNGTSAMAGMAVYNLARARRVLELAQIGTAWLTLALKGRPEAFGELVNERASRHRGQAEVARNIRELLMVEAHGGRPFAEIRIRENLTEEFIQDRYSLRCTPQILGPVADTLTQVESWTEEEINGVSDNPLFGEEGGMVTGGNFYGGYLSQGMDYLKISLAQIADLCDRQITYLLDEKSNRGLPPNLADWSGLPPDERFLHHGLKGLHQAIGALTSEVMALAVPNGIFSRSSESHNQDKVSLGMSAAVQADLMIEKVFSIQALYLVCLAQALDLREIRLKGTASLELFRFVRGYLPFIERDRETAQALGALNRGLQESAWGRAAPARRPVELRT